MSSMYSPHAIAATFHDEMSLSKEMAPANIMDMTRTDDVSHEEMSLSKEEAPSNMSIMERTADVFHDEMSLSKADVPRTWRPWW